MESAHIVRVYGVDVTPDGRPYFVMEYADDGSLEDRMRQRHDEGHAYSIDEAVAVSLAIADGLVDAQSRGIVHRDLKPSNVMFKTTTSGDNRLLLADFGIARSLEAAGGTTIAAGTPHYMAPEQTEGRADRASDVYSAAVILFELLAGRVPFPYKSAGQVIRAQITEQAPDIGTLRNDVPEALAVVLARGLSADTDLRQSSAAQWRADLAATTHGGSGAPAPGGGADPGATLGPGDLALLAAAGAGALSADAAAAATGPHGASTAASGPPTGAPEPPHTPGGPPPGGPGAPAGPSGNPPNKRRRRILAGTLAIIILAGVITGISLASAGTANAEVFRAPAKVTGANPFSSSVASAKANTVGLALLKPPATALTAPAKVVADSIPSFQGNTPGLYGGTRQLSTCDSSTLVSFLEANPDKAAAWAGVEGIATNGIAAYIGGLTDVVLRVDTRVTNHGFVDGRATTIPEVLQAGTAVLVDNFGVPRARCYCGNPLTPPAALSGVRYTGPSWPGFSPTKQVVIEPGPSVTKLVIVDVQTGVPFLRPTGTDGTADTDAPLTALVGSPFGGTASSGSPVVGGPPGPGAVSGTYTVANTTASSGCTGVQSGGSGATFTADVRGNKIELNLPGEKLSGPYHRSTALFGITEINSTALGQSAAASLHGTFVNGQDGAVETELDLPGGTNCTLSFTAARTGPLTPATSTTTTTPTTTTTTTTAPAQPVNITPEGTVSASSTYSSAYPASNAVDGNVGTSWFSIGAADGPSSTFTWQGKSDQEITSISITGNEYNSDPSNRSGYGYAQTEIQVINSAGTVVFDQTYPGPGDSAHDITATPNAVGETVKLILQNRESPDCGGFSELKIEAVP
jgi:hypothetical protein